MIDFWFQYNVAQKKRMLQENSAYGEIITERETCILPQQRILLYYARTIATEN